MHISDVHDYNPEPSQAVEEFLSKGRKEQLKAVAEQIVEDELERLQEYADEHISNVAADRAEKFLKRVLEGDADAAMAFLGDVKDSSRYRDYGTDKKNPWCHLIHGKLFETNGVELRRKVAEAHADLIRNERIKDLEAIVAGLEQQVRTLESDLVTYRNRVSYD